MRGIKKKRKIIIHHNRKLFWIIVVLIFAVILLIYFGIRSNGKKTYYLLNKDECIKVAEYPDKITFSHYADLEDCENLLIIECETDSECVPNKCCHPDQCIPIENKPVCEDFFCSAVCSGPLDCGKGHCACIKGKCDIVSS